MAEFDAEQPYPVPTHLKAGQTIGPFPARAVFSILYPTVLPGIPLGVTAWQVTHGLLPPAVGAALIPAAIASPLAAWWLDPPAEHGIAAAAGFVKRAWIPPSPPSPTQPIAVYRMRTINLETADASLRARARGQWAVILNGLTHPVKVIIRGRPLTMLPIVQALEDQPDEVCQDLAAWFEQRLTQHDLVDRDRLLVVPGRDGTELRFNTRALE